MTTTAPPKPQDGEMPDDCRKEFEDWFSNSDLDCPSLQKSSRCNGDYRLIQTQTAWNVWQGCWNNRMDTLAERLLDPDMPADQLRLAMGEMTAQEMRTARAAIRWANSMIKEAGHE